MKGITEEFLLFIVGIFVILVVLVTVFGRGIVYSILGTLAESEPSYLQENIRTILTVASYSPGEYEARLEIPAKHVISINDTLYPSVQVEATSQFKLSNTTPIAFLTECEIVKTCTKTCRFIGDSCALHEDCCGELSCEFGWCNSTKCGNGILEPGEECDLNITTGVTMDRNCPGQCQKNCTCPILHGVYIPQCNDKVDNDGDMLNDTDDPDCHTDNNPTNPASYNISDDTEGIPQCNDGRDNDGDMLRDRFDPACHTDGDALNFSSWDRKINREYKTSEESCRGDNECWNIFLSPVQTEGLECMIKIIFDKISESLIIRKYFENDKCKIKIDKG